MSSGEEGEVWPVKAVEAWAGLMCFGRVSQASRGGLGMVRAGRARRL